MKIVLLVGLVVLGPRQRYESIVRSVCKHRCGIGTWFVAVVGAVVIAVVAVVGNTVAIVVAAVVILDIFILDQSFVNKIFS